MSLSNYVKFGYVNGRPFLLGYKRREMLTSKSIFTHQKRKGKLMYSLSFSYTW